MGRALLPLLAGLTFMALAVATPAWAQIIIEPVPNPTENLPQDRGHSLRILPEPDAPENRVPGPGGPEPSPPEMNSPAGPPETSPAATSMARLALNAPTSLTSAALL